MRDFRLPPRCKWDLRSFGILRNAKWWFRTDASEHPIGPIFRGQALQLYCLTPKDGTTIPPRVQSQKSADLSVPDVSLASASSSDMALTLNAISNNDSDKKCADLVMRSRETLASWPLRAVSNSLFWYWTRVNVAEYSILEYTQV